MLVDEDDTADSSPHLVESFIKTSSTGNDLGSCSTIPNFDSAAKPKKKAVTP
jgi:hypothetical protein